MNPTILHRGARNGVTGSCHQLFVEGDNSLLVDCGLFQGTETAPDGKAGADRLDIDFPVAGIGALILTHVHIDHCGRLPWLLAAGFKGPILCSEPSARLLPTVSSATVVGDDIVVDGVLLGADSDDVTVSLYDPGDGMTVRSFDVVTTAADQHSLLVRCGNRLRAIDASRTPEDDAEAGDDKPSRKSGHIDPTRVRLAVEPAQDWAQMLREVWRLQRDHFWVEDMSGVDWQAMFRRYAPLLPRVATRGGVAPAAACAAGNVGEKRVVNYQADYIIWKAA